mgnify:CR=1 FL=1
MLKTIALPKNMKELNKQLPKAKYQTCQESSAEKKAFVEESVQKSDRAMSSKGKEKIEEK